MPRNLGRLNAPALPDAPASPVPGQLYLDQRDSRLYYWTGSTWALTSAGAQQQAAPVTSVAGRQGDVVLTVADVAGAVSSVAGRSGAVTLDNADVARSADLDTAQQVTGVKTFTSGALLAANLTASGSALNLRSSGGTTQVGIRSTGVTLFAGTADLSGGGTGVLGIGNAGAVPTANPTAGAALYAEGGVVKVRQSDGTVVTVANQRTDLVDLGSAQTVTGSKTLTAALALAAAAAATATTTEQRSPTLLLSATYWTGTASATATSTVQGRYSSAVGAFVNVDRPLQALALYEDGQRVYSPANPPPAPANVVTTNTAQAITASKTLTASAVDATPLTVQAITGQTADPVRVLSGTGATLLTVSPAGALNAVGGLLDNGQRAYSPSNDGRVLLTDTARTITATHTFSVAPVVPDGSFTVAKISATGTRSSSTFLRGDGSWQGGLAQTSGGNTFFGSQTFSSGTVTIGGQVNVNVSSGLRGVVHAPANNATATTPTYDSPQGVWRTHRWDGTTSAIEEVTLTARRGSAAVGDLWLAVDRPLRATALFEGTERVYSPSNPPPAPPAVAVVEPLVFFAPDALIVEDGTARLYVEHASTVESIRASVGLAPAGSPITVEVNTDGTVLTTVTIPEGANTALAAGIAGTAVPAGTYLTVDVTGVGSTTAGADLTVAVRLRRS